MTMQIAIVATDGLVLGSDTQQRVTERQQSSGQYVPDIPISQTKVCFCRKHTAAVAFAGWSPAESFAGEVLAKHLDSLPSIADDVIPEILRDWANDYYSKSRLAGAQSLTPLVSLLLLRPQTRAPIVKVLVNHDSCLRSSKNYMVNGHENNPGVFWPEYLRINHEKRDVESSTAIAAITILTAGEINPYSISGLEVWQWRESWRPLPDEEIEGLVRCFKTLQQSIKKTVRPRSKRDRSTPPPLQG